VPAPKTEVTRTVTTVNLDGTQLAKIIDERIAQSHENPEAGTHANGVATLDLNGGNPRDQ
jgi:hypothetical protein